MKTLTNQAQGAASPYLKIFADSPISWQEWNARTLEYAQENNRPLFVSVGTAETAVPRLMAKEVFAVDSIAEYLNTVFVPILVDRRQRPDIAHYLTEFALSRSGRVAWPIHAFLTPDLRPMYTFSYIGLESKNGAPGLMEVLWKMRGYFDENQRSLPDYPVEGTNYREASEQSETGTVSQLLPFISRQYDTSNGGFGEAPKFPPHSPLLFLLSLPETLEDQHISTAVRGSLDAMLTRGLWDRAHGGFFAYCADAEWSKPAAEKTLIDQALHLWNYSLAYRQYRHEPYRVAALQLKSCIKTQFRSGSLHISGLGFAADSVEVAKTDSTSTCCDENIVTAWNALLGCALAVAGKCEIDAESRREAQCIREALEAQHIAGGRLARSSYLGTLHPHVYLEDYSAIALLDAFLATPDDCSAARIFDDHKRLGSFFYGTGWINAIVDDFRPVPARDYDSPYPSAASLAELALLLIRMRLRGSRSHESHTYSSPLLELDSLTFGKPLVSDLRNLAAALDAGHHSPLVP